MKKLILFSLVFYLLICSVGAQNTADEKEQLKKINQEIIADYKAEKYDDALRLAQKSIDLSNKIYGAESLDSATAYKNLGLIYQIKKKYKEAAANLQKSVEIYQLKPEQNAKTLAKTLDQLALAYAFDGNSKEAEKIYILALTAAEKAFGQDGKDILPFLKSMTEVYLLVKKYDEAQQMFIRQYQTAKKTLPKNSDQLQTFEDSFYCFTVQYFGHTEAEKRQNQFNDAIRDETEKSLPKTSDGKTINAGTVNGKAKTLAKPEYPASARERGAQGSVLVRVLIDEDGKIISAKAFCGDSDLRAASEDAAKRSKFSPTLLEGKPVKVQGIITYNFIR